MPAVANETLDRLKAAVGPSGWTDDPELLAPHLVEWRDRHFGETPLMLSPASTAEVAAIVGICAETGTALTPQGGNTGLVGGQIPRGEVLLSLRRMNRIRDLDGYDDVLVAEAGVTLEAVRNAAADADRLFPLNLASGGTATVGGLVSTNAGGVAVLRYGTMRSLVLGLEAVLPDGSVFSGLKRLRKDNTGYDLKQLLIGAEGTLGVVTAAALKLHPVLRGRAVAMTGLASPQAALDFLALAKAESGGAVEAFELIGRSAMAIAVKNIESLREPLEAPHPWYVLVEIATAVDGEAEAVLERVLTAAFERALIQDAVVAQNEAQAKALWALREEQSAAQKSEGRSWKMDISVPVSAVPAFIEQASAAALAVSPGARVVAFGHVGDGNIHFNVLSPVGGIEAHEAKRLEGVGVCHDIAVSMGGSVSAEHGVGVLKIDDAMRQHPAATVAAMKAVRAALDPKRIMNPRVLF
jgi:FAD/FMN-containing dehydrogenase